MQNGGNVSAHLLRARAAQSRPVPLRNEPGLLTTLVPQGAEGGLVTGSVSVDPPLVTPP